MTTPGANPIEILSDAECWDLLGSVSVGRLAVDIAGQPEIFPINYVVDDGHLFFRSAAGTKLAGAVLSGKVAFEIDGYLPHERVAWSVVVKGRAALVERMMEVFEAEDLPLFPWIAFPKPDIVRITPSEVSGRRFHVMDTINPDDSIGWHGVARHDLDHDHDESLAVEASPDAEYHPGAPRLHPD